MINIIKFFLVFWISVTCAGIVFGVDECLAASEPGSTIPRHLEYAFTLQNTTNHVINEADLWTYAPVTLTATQQRIQVDASHPFEELSDEAGNSILHFTVLDIPPYATKIITIRADVLLSEIPVPFPENGKFTRNPKSEIRTLNSEPYLHPERYCESDDPDIIQLAKQLTADDPLRTMKNFANWITQNATYSGYLRNPREARYALKNKQGDCTEFM